MKTLVNLISRFLSSENIHKFNKINTLRFNQNNRELWMSPTLYCDRSVTHSE